MQHRSDFPTRRDLRYTGLRRAADAILNLLYPEVCLVCSEAVARAQDCAVCSKCWQKLLALRISRPWCPSCGLPYPPSESDAPRLCGDCILRPFPFAGARSFGYYSAELRCVIQALKFDGRSNLSCLLAPLMASAFLDSWGREEVDLVVPVPLHRKRLRERGYNQAALLARSLAQILGMQYEEKALARVRHTLPQVGLSNRVRRRNLRQAFHCLRPSLVKLRRVLLIDDVMTTGATAASASRALLDSGALRVSVLTLARTVTTME